MVIDIQDLIYYLEIKRGSVLSFVGSGGKTTLIKKLANVLKKYCRVCVGATTNMEYPEGQVLVLKRELEKDPLAFTDPCLVYAADEALQSKNKIHGFSKELMSWAKDNFDVILLESDGSHRRPLKGWAEYEPVVSEETDITIGVFPTPMIGQVLNEGNVHRFEYFTNITGAMPDDILTKEHVAAIISHPEGLFKSAVGEKVLFFSQAVTEELEELANDVLDLDNFDWIEKIVIGSILP